MKTHLVREISLTVLLIFCLSALPVFAEPIQIHITGLNFTYDGTDIFDSTNIAGGSYNTAQADPLTTIDFYKNSVYMGSLTANDNIFADLLIDNVKNIPNSGGMITTGDGLAGFGLDLLQNNGSQTTPLLSLKINQLPLSYSGAGIFVAVGGLADSIVAQNLPFGLTLSTQDPISLLVSSSNLTNVTSNGNFLSGFNAFGTSDINGTSTSNNVPEPATITALISLATVGLLTLVIRRRRQVCLNHTVHNEKHRGPSGKMALVLLSYFSLPTRRLD